MRTTLDITDDVLAAVQELARDEHCTVGEMLSRLARQALTTNSPAGQVTVAGFRPLPKRGNVVTNEHVNALRDIEGV